MSKNTEDKLIFGVGNEINYSNEQEWYQENIDTVIPLLIIFAGLFQFILRKWLFPVDDDVISKLEVQFPTQGLLYMPGFGMSLIIIGCILLIIGLL